MRERIGCTALRAYPQDVRTARGDEMLGTLLEVGEPSALAFARDCASLIVSGLRVRASRVASVGTPRLVADSCALAATVWMLLGLVNLISYRLTAPSQEFGVDDWLGVGALAVLLLAALSNLDRIVGGAGAGLIAGLTLFSGHESLSDRAFVLSAWAVPFACAVAMLIAPRRRTRGLGRLRQMAWLIALTPVLAVLGVSGHVFLAVVSVTGLFLLTTDPRLAIACGLMWTGVALTDIVQPLIFFNRAFSGWFLASALAPAMLAIAAARLRSIRRAEA